MTTQDFIAEDARPNVVEIRDVSKRFVLHKDKSLKERVLHPRRSREHRDDFWALKDVNLEIEAGSTIGLIGPNGSGKSTLLKTIGGIIEPTSGAVYSRGRLAALLELGAGFHPDLTGRENVYLNAAILGMDREETESRFEEIVDFSGIRPFIDTQVKFYSSGMYVRLAFAVAINVNPDVLLVDEVLAVGDEAFQKKCLDKIKQFQEEGRTIVIVSHSLPQIVELCTRAVVMGHGHVIFDGHPEDAVSILRAGFDSADQAESEQGRLERDRARIEEIARRRQLVQITNVTSTPSEGEDLLPGSTLEVAVTFETQLDLTAWDLTVALVNQLGTTVLVTSTHVSGLKNAPLGIGEHTINFTLPNLSMGAGEYLVTTTFLDDQRHELSRREDLGGFRAVTGPESIGPVYADASSTFLD
ncbi:polysaccharide ABC transporter ATP-binding protein [Gulosibacter sediminis]|uniref:ABC transporter ATP-binding protein n=1 Tax=Gulosibacter sediminis TaxID=1729695 RepID=UPI001865A5EE|nr:ABC transporter ATP-binding protein [Gulosibacter sediminis]